MVLYLVTVKRESQVIVEVDDDVSNPSSKAGAIAQVKLDDDDEDGFVLRDQMQTSVEKLVPQPAETGKE